MSISVGLIAGGLLLLDRLLEDSCCWTDCTMSVAVGLMLEESGE
jgi:hypothetical protein